MANTVQVIFRARDAMGDGMARVRSATSRLSRDLTRRLTRAGQQAGQGFASRFSDGLARMQSTAGRASQRVTRFLSRRFSQSGSTSGRVWALLFARFMVMGLGRAWTAAGRGARRLGRAGSQAGRDFSRGFVRFLGGMVRMVGRVGQQAGGAMSSAMQGAMKNPKLFAGVVIAAALVAPLIATILAGAVTLAFGGAMVGGAFALLISQSQVVKDRWSATLGELKNEFAEAARPMLPVLERARQSLTRLGPAVARAFERGLSIAAPAVSDFIARIERGMQAFGRSGVMASGMKAFADLLGEINIEGFFAQLGAAFNDLFQTVSQNKQAIGDLMNLLLMMIPTAIRMVSLLVKAWDALTNLPGIPMLISGLGKLSGRTDESRGAVDEFGNALEGADQKATAAEQALAQFRDQTQKLANQALQARGGVAGMEQAIDDAAEAVKENGRTLNLNTQAGRDNDAALRNIASSALTMKDSMLESGRSVEEVDRKTRRAREAFISTAMQMGLNKQEAQDLADKYGLIPDAKTTKLRAQNDTAPGIESAKKDVDEGWTDKVWSAVLDAKNWAGNALASAWETGSSWAGKVFTGLFTGNASGAWGGLGSALSAGSSWLGRKFAGFFNGNAGGSWRSLSSALSAGSSWAGRKFAGFFTGDAGGAWGSLGSALQAGYNWAGRVFTATFNVVRKIIPGFAKGGVIGAASGGPRSNTVLVGEQGPELVSLPGGSTVHTNGDSKRMLSAGGRGGGGEVLLRIEAGNSDLDRLLVQVLRKAIKNQHGGNVQVALGGRP